MASGLWAASPDTPPAHLTSVVRTDVRTGKLVRSVVVSARSVNSKSIEATVIAPKTITPAAAEVQPETPVPAGINELVESVAAQHQLPANLIHAVIRAESNYNPTAISPKGALGLMQLIPATARRFGVAHVFDPVENIQGGARYLRYLLDLYEGNYPLALAAYNAGEKAVARYNGIPPYPETQNYVLQVKRNLEKLAAASEARKTPPPAAQPAQPAPSGPAHIQEVVDPDGTVRYISR